MSKNKGDIAELKTMLFYEEHGITVLSPFGDKARYDLVIEENNKFQRIQVKYVSMLNGVIRVPNYSKVRHNNKKFKKVYTSEEIDLIIVYCPDTDCLYKIPIDKLEGHTEVLLRVEEPKIHKSNINYAKDYILA